MPFPYQKLINKQVKRKVGGGYNRLRQASRREEKEEEKKQEKKIRVEKI